MWTHGYDRGMDGKDYRVVRACTNFTAFPGAAQTCWKYIVW